MVLQEIRMNRLKKLLVVIASAGAMGSAQAVDTTFNLGTPSPTLKERTDVFAQTGYSFADLFNFTVDANYRTVNASPVKYSPNGIGAQLGDVTDLKLELFAGSDAAGASLGSVASLDGSLIGLSTLLDPGDFSYRVSGKTSGTLGGGLYFFVAAVPEPAEWMMLLCGLVVMTFMARRKTSLVTG